MNTYKNVLDKIKQYKSGGLSKSDIVVKTANDCIGWPYVYGGRGEECTPSNRKSRKNDDFPDTVNKCQVLNGSSTSCNGCEWHPDGCVLFFDCRGFTYWLMRLVGITLNGRGASSQYDDNNNWSEKGPIANMPKNQVCCVFRYDENTYRMEHTLLYDGNGHYIHCSGEVKKVAVSKYKATHYAIPKGLEGGVTPVPEPTVTAVVYAENGKPVKMRAKPNTSCKTYWDIPCGTTVDVLNPGEEWTYISDGKRSGYMMTKFLKYNADDEGMNENPVGDTVDLVIPGLSYEQAKEIMKTYPDAYLTVG